MDYKVKVTAKFLIIDEKGEHIHEKIAISHNQINCVLTKDNYKTITISFGNDIIHELHFTDSVVGEDIYKIIIGA